MVKIIALTMIVLCSFGMLFCFFMLRRNEYVCKIKLEWNSKVYVFRLNKIAKREYGFLEMVSYEDCSNAIWNYNKMFRRIDKWKINEMVNDQYLFELIDKSK